MAAPDDGGVDVRITVTSVLVDDQEKALRFYTDILGFVKKNDIPLGEARWLTIVSPDQPDGPALSLESDGHHAARTFKQARRGRDSLHLVRCRRRTR
jgi:catechol 2,3-dioxygenase-like lactoylglutathione lyase family enzyme